MLKLKRLRIDRFRNVKPGTELRFSDGFNVLLGQNGTGKTTLLELISMVVRSNFESLAKEEFAVEYELAEEWEKSIVVIVRNEREQNQEPLVFRATTEIRADNPLSAQSLVVRYDTEVGLQVDDHPPIKQRRGFSALKPWSLVVHGPPPLIILRSDFLLYASRARLAYRFDESLDLFAEITDSDRVPGLLVISDGSFLVPNISDPSLFPSAIVHHLSKRYERMRSDYTLPHSDLEFLSTINEIMGFSSVELKVDVMEQRVVDQKPESGWARFGNLVFRFWWESGDFITHHRLSYGQKRLLTFYYYLACNPDVVIADELVNGLHHRWITAAVEAIGERQAFLTSQNPLLLDYLPVTSPEQVRTSFVLCRSEPRDGRPGWIWENMSEDDAAELFAAYQVGIEHVSEILQSRGLW